MSATNHTRTMYVEGEVVAQDTDELPIGMTVRSIEDEFEVEAKAGGQVIKNVVRIVHEFDPPLFISGEVIDR